MGMSGELFDMGVDRVSPEGSEGHMRCVTVSEGGGGVFRAEGAAGARARRQTHELKEGGGGQQAEAERPGEQSRMQRHPPLPPRKALSSSS